VSWGASLHETQQAAHTLSEQGISAEVIDVATIKPLDMQTILQSVEKTGRCVIVHEAARTCGVGAEIAAQLAEHSLMSLRAPVQRVTGYDTVMPYYQLEKLYIPSVDRIVNAVAHTLEYA
jgi:pyruvate dehydrogenase E1 component beta subunit